MEPGIFALLLSAGTVILAEMGDKSQLLAMAFATKYKVSKVLTGIFIASVLNHGLAVAAGNYITRLGQGIEVWIQAIASLSFIVFGLWSLKGEKDESEEQRSTRFGAVATVAIATFFGEFGDKTQLTAMALATRFGTPFWVLAGTVSGMVLADCIGIVVGVIMCRKIPRRAIKLVSAGVFILFGFSGSYQVAVENLGWSVQTTLAVLLALAVLTVGIAYTLIKKSLNEEAESSEVAAYCKVRNQNPEPSPENK